MSRIRRLLRLPGHLGRVDDDVDDEIAFHIDQETEKNVRLGMSREEARRQALVQFGGLTQAREAHHEVYAARPVEDFVADVRYTLRTMRRTPALAGAAILTLALGVGAAMLLRGLVAPLVFGVTPGDPLTYSLAAVAFLGVALVAVALPARRGSRVEPVSALRWE